jgi:chromosome partitioning protein
MLKIFFKIFSHYLFISLLYTDYQVIDLLAIPKIISNKFKQNNQTIFDQPWSFTICKHFIKNRTFAFVMGIVVSLLNHKGGVGKTTSAINIGAGLVELGKKVLLIDLDPQANLTISLGIPRQRITIYEALRGEGELAPYTHKPNLDVITSSLDLSGAEMELINEAGREFILRDLISQVADDYDYILIDCPPSLGLLTLNALTSSRYVLIPLQTEFLAVQGLAKIKQVIDKVRMRLNKQLEMSGVIATMYDSRRVLNRDVVDIIHKYFGDKVFKTYIRDNVALAEAPAQRKDIFDYSPKSPGSVDYLALSKEILGRMENGKP